jgi:hypothetical protein
MQGVQFFSWIKFFLKIKDNAFAGTLTGTERARDCSGYPAAGEERTSEE